MDKLYFGTGGTPLSAKSRSSISGIERIAELGLGCMEVEFVQGVHMGEATAEQVREKAKSLDVKLTAHAPYYINFNAEEPDKIKASQQRLLQTARIGALCGAFSVVFHTASYMGGDHETAHSRIKKALAEVLDKLEKEDNHITLRPEVMGRATQFGTIDEVIRLCHELPRIAPCIDFAHWHARNGKSNSYEEFSAILKRLKAELGKEAIESMHMHISGIDYSDKGERKHLNLKDSDFHYEELLRALKEHKAKGVAICESHNLEEDAQLMQKTYKSLGKAGG